MSHVMTAAVDGKQGSVSRMRSMFNSRFDDDPGYFAAQKKPPGASAYFQRAWDTYNRSDFLYAGDNAFDDEADSDKLAIYNNAPCGASKDFAKGFDPEQTPDYDASTLHQKPRLPHYEASTAQTYKAPQKTEESDEEALSAADVAAAGARLAAEAGLKKADPSVRFGRSKAGEELSDEGGAQRHIKRGKDGKLESRVLGHSPGKKAPAPAAERYIQARYAKSGSVASTKTASTVAAPTPKPSSSQGTADPKAASSVGEKKKVSGVEGSSSSNASGSPLRTIQALRGRPSGTLTADAKEALPALAAAKLTPTQVQAVNRAVAGGGTDSRGRVLDKGDLGMPIAFWKETGKHPETVAQHEAIYEAIWASEGLPGVPKDIEDLREMTAGSFLGLTKEGRYFVADGVLKPTASGEVHSGVSSLSDSDIKILLNTFEDTIRKLDERGGLSTGAERRGIKAYSVLRRGETPQETGKRQTEHAAEKAKAPVSGKRAKTPSSGGGRRGE